MKTTATFYSLTANPEQPVARPIPDGLLAFAQAMGLYEKKYCLLNPLIGFASHEQDLENSTG